MARAMKLSSPETRPAFSAPCRIDMGGTLDIPTFFYPLNHLSPVTFNIALDMRTFVRLSPHEKGRVKVVSRGFDAADFAAGEAPFVHPLGLMFAVAAYFHADGVCVEIDSKSPPRSALGGSSVAAVAAVAAFLRLGGADPSAKGFRARAAAIAQRIEAVVAGVPCGSQDQLAAAFGGVNNWYWQADPEGPGFLREAAIPRGRSSDLGARLLVAYCGVPHASKDVNGTWVRGFLSGKDRGKWEEILRCTRGFTESIKRLEWAEAARLMNRETGIRRELTPEVVDDVGALLVDSAGKLGCGARFTGAGGGGCLWALGEPDAIAGLKIAWKRILGARKDACLLPPVIDWEGLRAEKS